MKLRKKIHALAFLTLLCFSQAAFADVEFVILSTWGEDNYCGEIRITSDTALSGWQVTATVNGAIHNVWNGSYRQVDSNPSYNAIFEPHEWNSTLPAGGTRSIGVCGAGEPPVINDGSGGDDSGHSNTQPLPITEIAAGHYGGVSEKRYVIANTEEDLQQIETLLGYKLTVEINRHTVIGAFLGERSTGGYDIQIAHAVETAETVDMLARLIEPGPTCMVTQAITSPYQVVVIPKTDKVINIIEQKIVQHCR